jgi:hypothetical protein
MWTSFLDMNSGGGRKEKWETIYIEAPQEEAKTIFFNKFGHNPERVTCTCCGDDYSISSEETLEYLTGYQRGCRSGYIKEDGTAHYGDDLFYQTPREDREKLKHQYFEEDDPERTWQTYIPLEEYSKLDSVLIIPANEIKEEWRHGEVPEQGYVWR